MLESPTFNEDEEHIRKRRRLDTIHQGSSNNHEHETVASTIQLSPEQYTVGWICALPVELTAAKVMLDIEHIPPKISDNHHNTYTVGSMCGYNVVIACLLHGSYGTSSAAKVAGDLMRDFVAIKIPLLVGIAGGVPTADHDIRLGDVVVSTGSSESPPVIQHDCGKIGADGKLVPKGTLNKPKTFLLRTAAIMKASHQTDGSRVPEYLRRALHRLSAPDEFVYPGIEYDVLHELICVSDQNQCSRSVCSGERLSERTARTSSDPLIHYGSVASGNQVIKDAHTRNRLAKDHKMLCFEMEAAGVMDEYQCLVIRGICDYCDTHKNKRFQGHAALAAAAVAKELLSLLSTKDPARTDPAIIAQRRAVMEALYFEESDSRRATVKRAHKHTCGWLLEQQEYMEWLNIDLFDQRHSLLWIKGKPGTGKSTIMKFALEEAIRQKKPDSIVISFFFNARGINLEKSTIGMYRSLLYQLFLAVPSLQLLLDNSSMKQHSADSFTVELLKDLLSSAIEALSSKTVTCLVDALDECPEDEIRDMIAFLQQLGELAHSSHVVLHVLISSRHYPNITIQEGTVLILENQDGHSRDIAKYINAELKIGKTKQAKEIEPEILMRSSGIFLWVVLVVRILNSEYDKGRVRGLMKRLEEIPTELDSLFRDIIGRDNQGLADLVLCMQWILYAARPLRREELYFALLAGDNSEPVPSWDFKLETPSIIDSRILDVSKGLAELTRSETPTVQFIHESVREFLLETDALNGLDTDNQDVSEGMSHQRLRECCESQLHLGVLSVLGVPQEFPKAKSRAVRSLREKAKILYPFLEYAVEHAPYHAEQAEHLGVSQLEYLCNLFHSPWLKLYVALERYDTRRVQLEHGKQVGLICYLATRSLQHLCASFLRSCSISSREDVVRQALKLLLKGKRFPGFIRLWNAFDNCANSLGDSDPTAKLLVVKDDFEAALYAAVEVECGRIVEMLIEAGAAFNNEQALLKAIEKRQGPMVQRLIEAGAPVSGEEALLLSVKQGCGAISRMLIEAGARVMPTGINGRY